MEFNDLISEIKELYQHVVKLFTTDFLTVFGTQLSLWNIILLVLVVAALVYISNKLSKFLNESFLTRYDISENARRTIGMGTGAIVLVLGLFIAVRSVDPDFSTFDFFTTDHFKLFGKPFSLWTLFSFVFSIILLVYVSGRISHLISEKILTRYRMDIGIRQSISTIARYLILILGLYIIISNTGIDLSALGVLAGALGVGIGFGLQNVTNNFISGLIILFERPIKVGDRIEVGDTNGDVVRISARATTIITNDNISIIIPNSEFISSKVINWSHNDRMVRFRFPIGVSYNEDPQQVKQLLMEVMKENTAILKSPPPDVWFDEFGDSSLNFTMMVWTSAYVQRPKSLKSQLYYAVFQKFKEHNIEIPFPQRDLHIKSGELPVNLKNKNGYATND